MVALFIVFQPVMIPVAYAVESWTGDSWKGESWEGESWDGSDLKWQGESWSEDGWTGDAWEGEGTDGSGTTIGEGWNGYDWESQPWYMRGWNGGSGFNGESWQLDGWNGNGHVGNDWRFPGWTSAAYKGDAWTESGFNGQGYQGNPWSQSGFNGNSYTGNPWLDRGFSGEGSSGNPWSSSGGAGAFTELNGYTPPERFYDSGEFKETKFVFDKLAVGTANFVTDGLNEGFSFGKTGWHLGDLLVSGAKLHTGDHVFYDVHDLTSKGKTIYDKSKAIENMRRADVAREITTSSAFRTNQISNASKFHQYGSIIKDSAGQLAQNMDVAKVASTWNNMGALSKFNFVTSGVNAGISAYKTGASITDAVQTFNSDASASDKTAAVATVGTNLGDTLMSAGAVASVVPGGQAVGAGLVAAGAGIYVVSKGVELVAKNSDKIASAAKKATDTVKNTLSKGFKKVKGWFS
ncbi:hypothetical protein [Lentibacillus saliphilus]|uniref:hypothetical protein n=1 Tax=Lentibacillus saliphilus TaxID=2737028 RepID=UPI001C2F192A|nr:hypothetical protein [Lentibacillus saliphilus]